MPKFKVGDKVRVVGNHSGGCWAIGYVGHITGMITPRTFEVDNYKVHSGCWYLSHELEKVEEEITEKLQSLKQLKDAVESGDVNNRVTLVDQCFDTIDQGTAALRAWSGSLNSAFDLQKQLLPSHSAVINTNGGAQLYDPIHGAQSTSFHSDPACAWLVAILNVLIAMEEET